MFDRSEHNGLTLTVEVVPVLVAGCTRCHLSLDSARGTETGGSVVDLHRRLRGEEPIFSVYDLPAMDSGDGLQ
jgi:hypothetical protein